MTKTEVRERNGLRSDFWGFLYYLKEHGEEIDCIECDFAEVFAIIEQERFASEIDVYNYSEFLRDGRDPWGSEILLYQDPAGYWALRSIGPNRIDEYGEGDDVVVMINMSN